MAAKDKESSGLSAAEKKAMRETMNERRREASGKSDGEADLLAKIAEMPKGDRAMAKRIHEIVMKTAPDLKPKTWYGMPAYAREGKVVCFFQSAAKFDARYATLGFNDNAKLDQGAMWPTSFALMEMDEKVEKKIASLVKKATR